MRRRFLISLLVCIVAVLTASITALAGSDSDYAYLGNCYVSVSASVSSDGHNASAQTTVSTNGAVWRASATAYWVNEFDDTLGTDTNGAEGNGPGGGGPTFNATGYKKYYKLESSHRATYNGATYTRSFTVYR